MIHDWVRLYEGDTYCEQKNICKAGDTNQRLYTFFYKQLSCYGLKLKNGQEIA